MKLEDVLLFLVLVIPASIGFQWTSSSQIPDGSSFRACVGDRASFPWSFSLSPGEHVISVEWNRTTDKGEAVLAVLAAGHFFPAAGHNVTFVPGGGLQVGHVSMAEFGTYSVRVNYNNNGSLLSSQQTAFLTMEDAPALADGHYMTAGVHPEPVLDDATGRPHVQLRCGHFLSLGSKPVSVLWKTPSDHTVASTAYINGTFRLNLPHPTQGGRYYCHLKDPSVAARCIPNVSRLMRGAYIHVDEVQIQMTLLQGGLQGLQAKNEKLDQKMNRQAVLDSELTAEVGRLAEITDMLLNRTEKLTSDNEILKTQTEKLTSDNEILKTQTKKLTSDNEILKTQTEKLTSDNEILKTQTEKLTSDNEILKTQTEKLTSDNERFASDNEKTKTQTENLTTNSEKLKAEVESLTWDKEQLKSENEVLKHKVQVMASKFTEETAKITSQVNKIAANTNELSTQLLALKSRSDAATKRISFFARLHQKELVAFEILTSTKVITNEGGAFNGTTGIFTVPVTGTYLFLVTIATSSGSKTKDNRDVDIRVDGKYMSRSRSSYYDNRYSMGSCHGLFRLTQGQEVWVQNEHGDTLFWSDLTTFAGALLHPDLPEELPHITGLLLPNRAAARPNAQKAIGPTSADVGPRTGRRRRPWRRPLRP